MVELLFGPLAGPECRRCVERRWMALVRVLAALPPAAIAATAAWLWFLKLKLNPVGVPGGLLSGTLVALDVVAIAIALLLTPALLAGVLAGERVRGTLELLLAARVNARDIILGRLLGRLSQVGVLLAAGLPCWVLVIAQAGLPWDCALALTILPLAVAWGGGGMAMAASVSARRGRDALIGVYFVEVICLMPAVLLLIAPVTVWGSVLSLNPFQGLAAAAWHGQSLPVWYSIAWWSGFGLLGTVWAAARLRPTYLRRTGGGVAARRRGRVPEVSDRPMLWKELHIERAKALGRVGRVLGWALIAAVLGGSVWMTAAIAWHAWQGASSLTLAGLRDVFAFWVNYTRNPLLWIIQCGVGLRAGVAIANERERATWEAVLISPLGPREIVLAKVLGSMHALRGLTAAALAAWTLALACGAIESWLYVQSIVELGLMVLFMAAAGVVASLHCKGSTGAMAVTISAWLVSLAVVAIAAAMLSGMVMLVLVLAESVYRITVGVAAPPAPPLGANAFPWLWTAFYWGLYVVLILGLIAYGQSAFDRLAGRTPTDPLRAVFFREQIARAGAASALSTVKEAPQAGEAIP